MEKASIHLGIGHYGIGFKDGVNTVISRNVRALFDVDPSLRITLFGKLAPDYEDFLEPVPGRLEYRNIEEFDPDVSARFIGGKTAVDQQVHDYIWQGTHLAEILVDRLVDMDVIMAENLGIGIQPYVTYAFFLYAQYIHNTGDGKKFIYRFHDFAQQRPANFRNVKKFHNYRFGIVPHWHNVLYPSFPNIMYVAINSYDRWRLLEHGIEDSNVFYIPNSVDRSVIPPDDRGGELRGRIIEREGLDPDVRFILYPVRCIRRKNVEEAIFLTQFFNRLAEGSASRENCRITGKYHLLVSLRPTGGDDLRYTEVLDRFVRQYGLPVSIGFDDLISLEREYEGGDRSHILRYGVGDLYTVADLVITTSVLEGFGFSYIEPWILDRAVIGRSIPFITPDFQSAGMKLGHLYGALIVDDHDYKDIGKSEDDPDEGVRIRLEKVRKLEDNRFIDEVINRNETAILATLRLFHEQKRKALVAVNRKVVEKAYSLERVGKLLYDVITAPVR